MINISFCSSFYWCVVGVERILGFALVLLLASGAAQVLTPLQEETIVLEIINIELSSNEIVLRSVTLVSLAPHTVSTSIIVNDSTITESIVTIRMMEDGHNRRSFRLSGDEPSKVEEWTPLSEHYIVNITSTGLVEQVRFNLTIIQTSEPGLPVFDPDFDPLWDMYIPALLASLLPMLGFCIVVVLYKKRLQNKDTGSEHGIMVPARRIAEVLAVMAILCPAYFIISSDYYDGRVFVTINSMIHYLSYWSSSTVPWRLGFQLDILLMLRFVFIWQIYKYYQGDTSKRTTFISGLVAEGPIILMSIYRLVIGLVQINLFIVPLPVFLLVGIILLLMLQPSEKIKDWTYVEEELVDDR